MRAVAYRGPHDLVVEERAEAPLAAGEVRVAVESVGVCGTDVRIVKGEHSAYAGVVGRVPGHEVVGRVAEIAPATDAGCAVGDLVFVAPNLGCGECAFCATGDENLCPATDGIGITLDGGFADSLVVPARAVAAGNLIRLEEGSSPDAAVLIEPLACVLRGQDKVGVREGDTVLVAGGGPVGLLHVALAVSRGARLVICSEPSPERRAAARRAGAAVVVDPTAEDLHAAVAHALGGRGPDVVVTAAPVHALQRQALEIAAVGGRVLLFGGLPKSRPTVEMDTNLIHYKELVVAGTTASNLTDCRRAAELVSGGAVDLDWMVSHVCALEDAARAVAQVQDASALKVILKPRPERSPS
ncbi:zinc-binding dehydrogenase [Cellulomonas xiejunii]|uniref:Alcohol dehydrogenase catalytic domain-containing protein n=1 Tax=Cellulomonas xiejunii TaxID=2968083 RepID=A0ABY5KNJ3_9CELL|nr:alcohol dehydrogenase catalytic domain-containing protein [Cellulomonas xiejunii]MCC2321484.1 alcohol dehydrogenase catalytic domain-containing protein [Cellulomonas xiejunii]MCC2323364.1 alcohol dehydrogenase catalytic domain-containing protein [Cellulomonas xiejunii]UUI72057.1 alcohol dehydrogenase catalytic domain-containing protein [Cellulomonas xiejunii]